MVVRVISVVLAVTIPDSFFSLADPLLFFFVAVAVFAFVFVTGGICASVMGGNREKRRKKKTETSKRAEGYLFIYYPGPAGKDERSGVCASPPGGAGVLGERGCGSDRMFQSPAHPLYALITHGSPAQK